MDRNLVGFMGSLGACAGVMRKRVARKWPGAAWPRARSRRQRAEHATVSPEYSKESSEFSGGDEGRRGARDHGDAGLWPLVGGDKSLRTDAVQ